MQTYTLQIQKSQHEHLPVPDIGTPTTFKEADGVMN